MISFFLARILSACLASDSNGSCLYGYKAMQVSASTESNSFCHIKVCAMSESLE